VYVFPYRDLPSLTPLPSRRLKIAFDYAPFLSNNGAPPFLLLGTLRKTSLRLGSLLINSPADFFGTIS